MFESNTPMSIDMAMSLAMAMNGKRHSRWFWSITIRRVQSLYWNYFWSVSLRECDWATCDSRALDDADVAFLRCTNRIIVGPAHWQWHSCYIRTLKIIGRIINAGLIIFGLLARNKDKENCQEQARVVICHFGIILLKLSKSLLIVEVALLLAFSF
jgi:hypothetical protein